MKRAPYVFVEPFCGIAGLSFWLMRSKPPISWMGNKFGYAHVIAELLGLSRLNPPAAYVWGDTGPNIAALSCLFGAAGSAEEVGRWLMSSAVTYQVGNPTSGLNPTAAYGSEWRSGGDVGYRPPTDPPKVAAQVGVLPSPRAPEVAAIIRGWREEEPRALWTRLKAAGWPSLLLPEGSAGRWLGPVGVEEVAAWLACSELAARGDPAAGYAGEQERFDAGKCWTKPNIAGVAASVAALPTKPPMVACWQGRAEDMVLPGDLSGWITYLDPPYSGTTGYKHGGCTRDAVLALARDYDRRGALVAISEAVRLDDALPGWHAVQIDGERRGQKRTFSKQQHEWVTMNRKPVVVPGVQGGLFGGAR